MKSSRLFRSLFRGIAIVIVFAASAPLEAATFTVTNINDSGAGSLRQAITDSNNAAGSDVIQFDTAGVFATAQTITLSSALPSINRTLEIIGPSGPGQGVTVSGNHASRIFSGSFTADGSLTLRHLTLINGSVADEGGGLKLTGAWAVALTLEDCHFSGCASTYGGALYANTTNLSTATIIGCTFDNNTVTTLSGGAAFLHSLANCTLTDCEFTGNSSPHAGGAVELYRCSTVSMTNCSFTGNDAATTGGGISISESATAMINACVFSNNSAGNSGGGVKLASAGQVTLRNSTISGNAVTGTIGGGISLYGPTQLTAESCTISGNSAVSYGGGIEHQGSLGMTLVNCTVSGNSSESDGGGIHISTSGLNALLLNCTVTANTAAGSGGGFYLRGTGTVTLGNTIVAGNTATVAIPNINSTPTSLGHNLIGIDDSALTHGVNGDIIGSAASPVNALLGPLASNGGPTQTHAPLAGSPVLEAGDSSLVTSPPFTGPLFKDQIGNARFHGMVDIGLVESGAAYIVTNTNDSGPGSLRDAIADTEITISFDPAVFGTTQQTITLTSGELVVSSYVKIIGPAPGVVISGNNTSNVFFISAYNGTVELERLHVTNGSGTAGAGLTIIDSGSSGGANVVMRDCSVTQCTASAGGGGVYVTVSTLTATRCAFSSNTADNGGGVSATSNSICHFTNCTFLGNEAEDDGGALNVNGSTARLVNCTLAWNGADTDVDNDGNGGGIYSISSTVNVGNGIIAQNNDHTNQAEDVWGTYYSLGSNLVRIADGQNTGAGTPFTNGVNGDITGTAAAPAAPGFGAIGNFGGLFSCQSLLAGSAAVDSGNTALLLDSAWPATPTRDVRGQFRVVGAAVDRGSYEGPAGSVATFVMLDQLTAEQGPGGAASFLLMRSFPQALGTCTLTKATSSSAPDTDYTLSGGGITATGPEQWAVTFIAGRELHLVTVSAVDDTAVEPLRTWIPTLTGSGSLAVSNGTEGSRTIDVVSDDFLVTTAVGFGAGSLRQAIVGANLIGAGRIRFDETGVFATSRLITLTSALPEFTGSRLDLVGPALLTRRVFIKGDHTFPLLSCSMSGGELVSVRNLSFLDGNGGVLIACNRATVDMHACSITSCENSFSPTLQVTGAASTTITNCLIDQNIAGIEGYTGVLLDGGTALVERTAITRNTSGWGFGGLSSVGQDIVLRNCTLSGNTAHVGAGGLALVGPGSALIDHCTITANHSADGDNPLDIVACGGVAKEAGYPCTLRASIISGNTGGALNVASDLRANYLSGGHNLIGSMSGASGITHGVNNDEIGLDPVLGILRNNGGGTLTHALRPGSPAINAASPTGAPTTDQRNAARDVTPDIGAYEAALESYAYWAEHEFGGAPLSGIADDFDGDGIANGIEYLTGTDPTEPKSQPRLRPRMQGGQFIVEFDRSALVAPEQIVISISTDLVNWTSILYPNGRTLGGPSANVVAGWLEEFAMSPPIEGRLFVRIEPAP